MNTAAHATARSEHGDHAHLEWEMLASTAPQLTVTFRRYLTQLGSFLQASSVVVADTTLRQLARWLTDTTDITAVADITRSTIEDYKVWLAAQPGVKSPHSRRTRNAIDSG